MILPFWIYGVNNPVFRAMTGVFMTVLANRENINPIPVSRPPITGVMHLFGLINHAHTANTIGSCVCVTALFFVLFDIVPISNLIVSHFDK
jgi:hypothetical protein